MLLAGLHFPEEHVRAHGFGHEMRRADQLTERPGLRGAAVDEKVPGSQQADDVVDGVLVDREAGQAAFGDGFVNFVLGGFHVDGGDVLAMSHAVLGVHVVELEDVFDHFLFVGLDRTLLLADVHHHADFLFRHALRGVGGLKVKGLQQRAADPVGGLRHRREQPYGPFCRGGDALERLLRPAGGERAGENARQREGDDAEGNQRNQRAQRRGNMQRGAHAGADRPRQRRKGRGDQRGVGHSDFTEAIVIAV